MNNLQLFSKGHDWGVRRIYYQMLFVDNVDIGMHCYLKDEFPVLIACMLNMRHVVFHSYKSLSYKLFILILVIGRNWRNCSPACL